jgi:cytochrome c oxidase assembly protein subunit 15
MTDRTKASPAATSPWPRRFAVATLAAAVPLVFFGGTVTTLHAGLAIDGWLVLEPGRGDHFLWLYPVDKWFRDLGTFVEHTHRLLGSLVGLLAIATVIATWATDRRRLPRALSIAALLAVVAQGTIGGLRVLEKSEDLAFLHGAIAQAVFAVLGASCVAASPVFGAGGSAFRDGASLQAGRLRALSIVSVGAVYLQIVAGAWLRHGGGGAALALHGVLALAVVVCAALLARQMRLCAGDLAQDLDGPARSRILALRRGLIVSLALQLALGVAALAVVYWLVGPNPDGLGSSVVPTLHVVGGGALLLACVASSMWLHRLFPARTHDSLGRREPELEAHPSLEAVR